ncbi:glycosyltransferase, partial [Candidatus Amoebophilus asiaticus]|nr:glycosyltransferase [Candidatus Amoebophilus asiaticus]
MKIEELINKLNNENLDTWFDLGLFLDRIKDLQSKSPRKSPPDFDKFKAQIAKGGIAFITFHYAVDGVTVEIRKYAKAFRKIFKDTPIHYIGGEFYPESDRFIPPGVKTLAIPEIKGFDKWPLYNQFFRIKLERGSTEYNQLITAFRSEVLEITEILGNYIEKNNISLLYLINVCSNPGNISLALATILISEYMRIPVINNNHDFYWEAGNKQIDIITKGLQPGPRDFFFTNCHLGEVFSPIEVLYPWNSRHWMTVNINKNQSIHVIEKNGHNPANVCEIGTAVDTDLYKIITKRNKINAFLQVQAMLSRYKERLKVHTVKTLIKTQPVNEIDSYPLLIGNKQLNSFDFVNNNIVFLQPTRIMPRKTIDIGFKLVEKLFEKDEFTVKFINNPQLKLSILVSGPIPIGQTGYFYKLLQSFDDLLKKLKPKFRERVYLGFLFSEFDKGRYKGKFKQPIDIPQLYNIASLVLLPSETEGRGLPIIESTACGIPIFCRRYYPENVYAEVIGEHLQEEDRLIVLEYDGKNLHHKLVSNIIERIFFPQNYINELEHNRNVVNKRFSLTSLQTNLEQILYRLFLQSQNNKLPYEKAGLAIKKYQEINNKGKERARHILNTQNRQYLAGYGKLSFMLYLKSLIDPSFFRVEEQEIRGMAMRFAKRLVNETPSTRDVLENSTDKIAQQKLHLFYNTVENIFLYHKGEVPIRHDHSFAYRHRNRVWFPYQDFTYQELTGLINLIFHQLFRPEDHAAFRKAPHFFTDWNLALFQLTNSENLVIDDRERLTKMLQTNIP